MTMNIQRDYNYHRPNEEAIDKHDNVRTSFQNLVKFLFVEIPDCKEKAECDKCLQMAMFWANAAIAREISIKEPNATPDAI